MQKGLAQMYRATQQTAFFTIHWAGTEIAERWAGFFDSAMRTGEATVEVMQSLLLTKPIKYGLATANG